MKLPLLAGECAGDTGFQYVEGGALYAVAEEEALAARKPVEGRDEPENEAVVELEGGASLAGAVTGGFAGLATGRGRCVRFSLRQVLFRSGGSKGVACRDPGAPPPGPPNRR